jgi:(1->4)-alpha-D-glucan 1-alpha-D-glucosylmutase
MLNSLSQVLLKLTSPGVPDLYQGNETWDLSLVDPDNRRAVDYELRRKALADVTALAEGEDRPIRASRLFASLADPRSKLYFVWRLLALRKRERALFLSGGYTALKAQGRHAEHVVAFARRNAERTAIVVGGRLFARLGIEAGRLPCGGDVWGDTRIKLPFLHDGARLTDWLTGEAREVRDGGVQMAQVWNDLPGAVLLGEDRRSSPRRAPRPRG